MYYSGLGEIYSPKTKLYIYIYVDIYIAFMFLFCDTHLEAKVSFMMVKEI